MKPLKFKVINKDGKVTDHDELIKSMTYRSLVNTRKLVIQFIGRKDCNGQELYESDHVKIVGTEKSGCINMIEGRYVAMCGSIDVLSYPDDNIVKL